MSNRPRRRPPTGSPMVNTGKPRCMGVFKVFKYPCGHKIAGLTRPAVCPICGVCESCSEMNDNGVKL